MPDISLEAVTGKLNRVGYDAFIQALRHAKGAGNRNVELAHWLLHILQKERTDIGLAADHFKLDRAKLMDDIAKVGRRFPQERNRDAGRLQHRDRRSRPRLALRHAVLRRDPNPHRSCAGGGAQGAGPEPRAPPHLEGIRQDQCRCALGEHRNDLRRARTRRTCGRWTARVCALPGRRARKPRGPKGTTPLDRFSQDLTAKAKAGEMDPILGRDEEIRQIIDVLMRRRQNNPDPHRRSRRRQDRRGRRLRPARRIRRRAAAAAGRARLCARHRADAGRRIDEGRVRAAPALSNRRGAGFAEADHPVHRRSAYADRGGRPGRHRRCRQSAQTGARARDAAHDRRHHLVGISPIYREGPGADTALPADPDRRTGRRALLRHAARHSRADGEAPQGAHLRRRHRRGGSAFQPLHPGAAIARQGGEPARHRIGARRHQPERHAGDDRGRPCCDHRARSGEGGAGQRQRSRRGRAGTHRGDRYRNRVAEGKARRSRNRMGDRAEAGRRNPQPARHPQPKGSRQEGQPERTFAAPKSA